MSGSAAYDDMLFRESAGSPPASAADAVRLAITATHDLADVEGDWRALTQGAIESPGQSVDFIRLWMEALRIPPANRYFVVAHLDGAPVALVPLQRRWDKGVRVLSWFPGPHVGCNAPLVDAARLAALSPDERRQLWRRMLRSLTGADVVYLKAVPQLVAGGVDLFAELGQVLAAGTLYRASFSSFAEADTTQRTRSRRKHDRQQGDRLNALGEVVFEEIANGPAAMPALATMFRQRAARFRQMGVSDPFAPPPVRAFYESTMAPDSGLDVRLHTLRLDGEIVAVRYNVVHGDRLFCLISSMSDDAAMQAGSPGKQCLLRVMETVFDAGYRVFDMGEGLTDEKRHWCNELIPLRHHYVPITRRGALAAHGHQGWFALRRRIKNDARLLRVVKAVRARLGRR